MKRFLVLALLLSGCTDSKYPDHYLDMKKDKDGQSWICRWDSMNEVYVRQNSDGTVAACFTFIPDGKRQNSKSYCGTLHNP